MADPLISVRELTKTYSLGEALAAVQALRGVTLDVQRGEFIALTGPSGSGKSTFMNLLGCLDHPTSGEYWLNGQNVAACSKNELAEIRNRDIGFVFQGFNLLPRTSAIDNVEFPLLYGGALSSAHDGRTGRRGAGRRSGSAIGMLHHPSQMSGGQQQRVAIARALVNDPMLLLADEPTGNLDSKTSIEVIEIFQRLNVERHLTILLVTHEPDIAQYAARRIAFRDGRIRSDEPVADRHTATKDLAAIRAAVEPVALSA